MCPAEIVGTVPPKLGVFRWAIAAFPAELVPLNVGVFFTEPLLCFQRELWPQIRVFSTKLLLCVQWRLCHQNFFNEL